MPPGMYQWTFLSATSCWNCSSVGEGSVELKPPTGMTGSSVASW